MKDIEKRLKDLETKQNELAKCNNTETFYYIDGRIERVKRIDVVRKVLNEYEQIDHIEPSFPLLNAILGGLKQ